MRVHVQGLIIQSSGMNGCVEESATYISTDTSEEIYYSQYYMHSNSMGWRSYIRIKEPELSDI